MMTESSSSGSRVILPPFIEDRRGLSQGRVAELSKKLTALSEVQALGDLTIYATGSYARLEASVHSDLDLFFLHPGSASNSPVSRLDELSLFAGVIRVARELEFPTFSNDGEFLRILHLQDILDNLGGREDDSGNFFTARMLLLLESAPLVNEAEYRRVVESITDAYFRDYPDHSDDFRPVFFINDVIRFWKTLCLNYEHRRNKPADKPGAKRKQQVKNFKLKFSRLMTCFGSVASVCSMAPPIERDAILGLTSSPPLDRLLACASVVEDLDDVCRKIISEYEWFMQLTGLTTEELESNFEDRAAKVELFERADHFGELVYKVVEHFARLNNYRRFLVM